MTFHITCLVLRAVCLVLLEDRRADEVIMKSLAFLCHRSSLYNITHSPVARVPHFLFLPHFDDNCDLLLNGSTATWNLFVKQTIL